VTDSGVPSGGQSGERRRRWPRRVGSVLWRALDEWSHHKAPTRSAAIAFYSLTSLAPVSVLLVWIGGLAWEGESVRAQIIERLTDAAGADAASMVAAVLVDAASPGGEVVLTAVLAGLLFAFSATAVFAQLQDALRDVWDVPAPSGHRVGSFIRKRVVALALVGVLGLVLMLSMFSSVVVSSIASVLPAGVSPLTRLTEIGLSAVTLIVLFTLVFRILPDAEVPWLEAGLGGLVAGSLHVLGQWGMGLYLGSTALASVYGAAASFVVFLMWVYYSSLVFLYGAEITRALAVPAVSSS